jgi:hypothetical protein
MRKPQLYFSSKKNSEEWPANFLSDGEKRFVGESWFAHHLNRGTTLRVLEREEASKKEGLVIVHSERCIFISKVYTLQYHMSYFRTLTIVGLTYIVASIFIFILISLVESEILSLFISYVTAFGGGDLEGLVFPLLTILCLSLVFASISRSKNLIKAISFFSLLCSALFFISVSDADGFGALIVLSLGIVFGGIFLISLIFYAVVFFLEKKYGAITLVSPENTHSTWNVILYTVLGLSVVLYSITLLASIRPLLVKISDTLFGSNLDIFFYLTLLIVPCLAYVFIRSIHVYIKSEETYKHYTLAYFSTVVMFYVVAFLPALISSLILR